MPHKYQNAIRQRVSHQSPRSMCVGVTKTVTADEKKTLQRHFFTITPFMGSGVGRPGPQKNISLPQIVQLIYASSLLRNQYSYEIWKSEARYYSSHNTFGCAYHRRQLFERERLTEVKRRQMEECKSSIPRALFVCF